MSWFNSTLGEIYDKEGGKIQTGPFGSQLHESDYTEFGVPVIMPKDIVNDELDTSSIARISEKDALRLKKHIVKENDIIFPRRGEINKRILIDEQSKNAFCGTGCIRLRGTGRVLDPLFLFYYTKQNSVVKWIENQAVGATMMNLNTSILKSVPIYFPKKIKTQQKIASILSAYDNLIENNNQRIQLLEEMAGEIYKEWFVCLRFPATAATPGYKDAVFVDKNGNKVKRGTAGALPEGWESVKIGKSLKILGGGTPSTKEEKYWKDGSINWYSPTDITGGSSFFFEKSKRQITQTGLVNSSAKIFPKYSVMMTSRATIGAIGINTTEACTNQGFITILPHSHFPYTYIYFWLKHNKSLIESHSSGATFKEISRSAFKNLGILKPNPEIVTLFQNKIEPMFKQINILNNKNQLLQETRDLLLPRLISGKLSVENMELEPEHTLAMAAEPGETYKSVKHQME